MRTSAFLLLVALLVAGCMKPKLDITGVYTNDKGITLTIGEGVFTVKNGNDTVKGETSKQGSTLWLHPKTLNDRDRDGAFLHSVDQARTTGTVTDAAVQGSTFDAVELTIGEEGKTLTVTMLPKFKSGAEPYYNVLGTLTKN